MSETLGMIWNDEVEEVEEVGGIKDSEVGSAGFVDGRIRNSTVDEVGKLVNDRGYSGAIEESEVGHVEELLADSYGIEDTEVGSVNHVLSQRVGISDSVVDEVNAVASASYGIQDSEIDSVGRVFAETGIDNSEIDHLELVDADRPGRGDSKGITDSVIEEVEKIDADIGVLGDSEIDSIETIKSGSTGVSGDAFVGTVDSIESSGVGIRASPHVEYVGEISADGDGIRGSEGQLIEEVGSIEAGKNAIGYKSNVKEVKGPVTAGDHLVRTAQNPIKFTEDVEAGDKLFADTEGHIIVNDSTEASVVDGGLLERGGSKNLVITGDLDVEESLAGRSTVITPEDQEGTVDYLGDFSNLQEVAQKEGVEFLEGLKKFGTPVRRFSDIQELREEDSRQLDLYDRALSNLDIDEDEFEEFDDFTRSFPVDSLYQARIGERLSRDLGEKAWPKILKTAEFGEVLSDMDREYRSEFMDRLMTEKDRQVLAGEENEHTGEDVWFGDGESSLGDRLFRMALDREFYVFVDDEASQIEGLLDESGEIPDVDSIMDGINVPEIEDGYSPDFSDSPYLDVLEEMVDRYEDDIRLLSGLSDVIDVEGNPFDSLKPVKDLKDREVGRHAQIQNSGLDPEDVNERLDEDPDEYSDWFEEHIDSKIRDYIQDAVSEIGKQEAEELYSEVADGQKDAEEIGDGELAALMVYARSDEMSELEDDDAIGWSRAKETVQKLFDHGEEVYDEGENGEWLDEHGYSVKQLTDPELSPDDMSLFEDAEGMDSALRAKIDAGDIEVDTDERQEKYMDQVRTYMQDLGLDVPDEISDIDQVQRQLKDLDSEKRQSMEYHEAMDAINNYKAAGNMEGGVPDEMVFRVASPMETTLMGKGLQSCHDAELGSYGWAAISHAVKPNTIVMNAGETEDDIQARVKAYVTEDEDLVYHHTSQYQSIDADLSQYFEEYMSEVSHQLDLGEPVHAEDKDDWEDKFELLEAHDQYLRE